MSNCSGTFAPTLYFAQKTFLTLTFRLPRHIYVMPWRVMSYAWRMADVGRDKWCVRRGSMCDEYHKINHMLRWVTCCACFMFYSWRVLNDKVCMMEEGPSILYDECNDESCLMHIHDVCWMTWCAWKGTVNMWCMLDDVCWVLQCAYRVTLCVWCIIHDKSWMMQFTRRVMLNKWYMFDDVCWAL